MSYREALSGPFLRSIAALVCAAALAACGSSASTSTSPSTIAKCVVAFDTPAVPLPAGGGTGAIPVKAERECAWTAESSDAWLSITAGRSGQGNGTVEFAVAANADPVARTGGIMLNGSRAQVAQAASECRYSLAATSTSMGPTGGTGSVDVGASSALCTWSAASNAEWIAVTSGPTGKGSATVSFTVAPSTGPPRAGTLTIAGLSFEVSQSEGCTYAIAPPTFAAGAAGATSAVTVTAPPGCPWTTSNSVSWITLATPSGSGNGTVGFTVAATTGPTRSGTLTIAGQPFTVTQSPGCAYDVSPLTHAVDASGGARTSTVTAAAGCAWTASSTVPWITITAGASGSGPGTVAFTVAPVTGPSRTGTIAVGGQIVTVVQSQGCTFTISPETQSMPASGGGGSVAVTAPAGCAWTATSGASWITIASGATGSGNGGVTFTVGPSSGPARTGALTIAGQTFTVQQASGCTYSLSPQDRSVPSTGGTGSFTVSTAGACTWAAIANAPWLAVTSGGGGTGAGTVEFRAIANTGAARSGTISVTSGQTFTVTQGAACNPVVAPETIAATAAGGSQTVNVTALAECPWTAVSNAAWVAITAGASGSGNGTVALDIQANTGPARNATATIAGATVGITQESGCTFSIPPATRAMPVGGGTGSVAVTAGAGCAWTAVSNAAWITVTRGGSGAGAGTVEFIVDANATGAPRTGTITIAGQTFTVEQAGA